MQSISLGSWPILWVLQYTDMFNFKIQYDNNNDNNNHKYNDNLIFYSYGLIETSYNNK